MLRRGFRPLMAAGAGAGAGAMPTSFVPAQAPKNRSHAMGVAYTSPLYEKALGLQREIDTMIRVDHAGETGAVRICQAQLMVRENAIVREILEQEADHLRQMEELVAKYGVNTTILDPLWYVGATALGVGTAALGESAAMACHVAVENVIAGHYNEQLRQLLALEGELGATAEGLPKEVEGGEVGNDGESTAATLERLKGEVGSLLKTITKLRDEEVHHHDISLAAGASEAPFYSALSAGITTACNVAIALTKRC